MGEHVEYLSKIDPHVKRHAKILAEMEPGIVQRAKELVRIEERQGVIRTSLIESGIMLSRKSGIGPIYNGTHFCKICLHNINRPVCWPKGITPAHNCVLPSGLDLLQEQTVILDPISESIQAAREQYEKNKHLEGKILRAIQIAKAKNLGIDLKEIEGLMIQA